MAEDTRPTDNRVRTEEGVQAACERFMAGMLRAQLHELDLIGMGHIPFAISARRSLLRLEAQIDAPREALPSPRLRLVQES